MTSTATPRKTARFALSVRGACDAAGISHGQLAEGLGISQESLSRKLTAKIRWNLDEMWEIADIFGVKAGDMVNGSGEWLHAIDSEGVRKRLSERVTFTT